MIAEMMKKTQRSKSTSARVVGYYLLGVLAGLMGIVAMTRLIWHSKFYPNVYVAQVNVSGMTRVEAEVALKSAIDATNLSLTYGDYTWPLPASAVPVLLEESLNEAYRVGRRLNLADYALIFVNKPQVFDLVLGEGTTEAYNQPVATIAQSVEVPAATATVTLTQGSAVVTNGIDGVYVDNALLLQLVRDHVATLTLTPISIPTTVRRAHLSADQLLTLGKRAENLSTKELVLTFEDERERMTTSSLIAFLATTPESESLPLLDPSVIAEYVAGLSESYDRAAEDARFAFAEGRVTEFAPGKDGIIILQPETVRVMTEGITTLLSGKEKTISVALVASRTPPTVTMDRINEYGIEERIGRGESYYAHSIANRVYNVGLASTRTNSAFIPPGEEYSFNKTVGEISGATGYKTAYVISGGRTVLGDGGGVCQVSTTLFRAAMNAGLPIMERWAHAYRVGYYEQNSKPGVDATVYSPSKDFRFKNDTPGHILVQIINDPKNLHLVVEIYGTSDGRVATVSEPVVTGVTPPPPDIYQDDPSLPSGQVKQVDWSASGARASFTYKVVRGNEVLQDKTFVSAYRPWANVYLRGVGQ
jgi:vancomycin resistance protein YoaR